jgi:hypothetical protein
MQDGKTQSWQGVTQAPHASQVQLLLRDLKQVKLYGGVRSLQAVQQARHEGLLNLDVLCGGGKVEAVVV